MLQALLRYASMTTVDVERSFSMFRNVLSENRRSFTPKNLEMTIVIYCNAKRSMQSPLRSTSTCAANCTVLHSFTCILALFEIVTILFFFASIFIVQICGGKGVHAPLLINIFAYITILPFLHRVIDSEVGVFFSFVFAPLGVCYAFSPLPWFSILVPVGRLGPFSLTPFTQYQSDLMLETFGTSYRVWLDGLASKIHYVKRETGGEKRDGVKKQVVLPISQKECMQFTNPVVQRRSD
ncbi:hypothetical protein ANN_08641 [Periplaneta americana]|uniref:HAT C-terminal dimerisation domain-containing protein n=1 Tax=Periplaneta americana TaxID=6978 RepID=A0ABQ8T1Y8_PERAM|nr:hypothetical protein ANN_08641 [Periplaneta americana]